MPSEGASWRGEQLSLLARLLHARQSSKHFEDLLLEAKVELEEACSSGDLAPVQVSEKCRNIELLEQDLTRQKNLDPKLVGQIATAKAEGYKLWQQARASSDFSIFSPALE